MKWKHFKIQSHLEQKDAYLRPIPLREKMWVLTANDRIKFLIVEPSWKRYGVYIFWKNSKRYYYNTEI